LARTAVGGELLKIRRQSAFGIGLYNVLKDSEEKGVTVDLKGTDTKAVELKLIQMKSTAMARE
jgi:hypothetical protein